MRTVSKFSFLEAYGFWSVPLTARHSVICDLLGILNGHDVDAMSLCGALIFEALNISLEWKKWQKYFRLESDVQLPDAA